MGAVLSYDSLPRDLYYQVGEKIILEFSTRLMSTGFM